jgi:hypothetical protein
MRFQLTITLGNDAMQTGDDVAAALHKAAEHVDGYDLKSKTLPGMVHAIFDANGNRVGNWKVTK